jgi:hypothetical protein
MRTAFVSVELAGSQRAALRLLLQAWDYAEMGHRHPWDFAVEIVDLRAAGLTTAELRLLFCQGQVEHAVEETKPGANHRRFGTRGGLLFCEKTCFVLTEAGAALARSFRDGPLLAVPDGPFYDRELRELLLGKMLVKRFSQPAPEQEAILRRFQDEQWKRRITSPLAAHNFDEDPRLRLHYAVRRLNRHQIHPLISFYRDGTGDGICWQTVQEQEAPERRP